MHNAKSIMQPFWLFFWSCTLMLGWLLPNHYRPWLAFHSDAWIGIALLLAAFAICFRSKREIFFYRMEVLALALIGLVWVQHFLGLIPFAGVAWISSIYLFGFAAAMVAGASWERASPNQFADALFLAIGAAAIFSVGIELYQWFQLDGLALWIMDGGENRPHANLGQANQLATFLIWGLLAIGWGATRRFVGVRVGVLMSAYLLFGIALTGSRAAWIGILLVVAAAWFWRSLCPWEKMPMTVTALAGYFVLCILGIGWSQSNWATDLGNRMTIGLRPIAWKAFLDAASRHPWAGYGWNQTASAQMEVAADHPYIPGVFSYAHNLFLDLVLWCGIPVGLLVSCFLLRWLWVQFRKVDSVRDALLFLFVLVIANHAMLENPLYFGYFLLPTGMVIGVMNVRAGMKPFFVLGRWSFALMVTIAASVLTLLIRDYAQVEETYGITRLQWEHIQVKPPEPLDVIFLTQWEDFFDYAKSESRPGLGEDELAWRRNVTNLFPGPLFFYKLASAQALNGHPQDAELSLRRMCKFVSEPDQLTVKDMWAKQAKENKEISVVMWPKDVCP